MTSAAVSTSSRPALRLPVFIALGVVFWFLAALAFRFLGPFILVPGSATLPLVFLLTVPVAWAFVWAGITLGGVKGAAVLPAAVIMSATAMLLDSLALTFFPALYNLPTSSLLIVAAVLLWGVGLILIIAYVWPQHAE